MHSTLFLVIQDWFVSSFQHHKWKYWMLEPLQRPCWTFNLCSISIMIENNKETLYTHVQAVVHKFCSYMSIVEQALSVLWWSLVHNQNGSGWKYLAPYQSYMRGSQRAISLRGNHGPRGLEEDIKHRFTKGFFTRPSWKKLHVNKEERRRPLVMFAMQWTNFEWLLWLKLRKLYLLKGPIHCHASCNASVFRSVWAIHVMHHAHEACMKRIKLVWYFVGGASCKDRCMRLCMKCVVPFHVRHQFLAIIICCQGCKIMDQGHQANKWMKIQAQIHENLHL